MTIKTVLLPAEKAAFIQSHASEYGCTLTDIAVASNHNAKVTIVGNNENVKKLFDEIGE